MKILALTAALAVAATAAEGPSEQGWVCVCKGWNQKEGGWWAMEGWDKKECANWESWWAEQAGVAPSGWKWGPCTWRTWSWKGWQNWNVWDGWRSWTGRFVVRQ